MHFVRYGPLRPSSNSVVFKDELCDFWIDEEGILCSVAKNIKRTIELQRASFALIRKMIGNQKVCHLADVNNTGSQDQECRKHANHEIPHLFNAIAFSASSSMGQLVANTFLTFGPQSIPIQIFENHVDAKKWLVQYL